MRIAPAVPNMWTKYTVVRSYTLTSTWWEGPRWRGPFAVLRDRCPTQRVRRTVAPARL